MTQSVFNDIDPNVTSGTELAGYLNDFKASILSGHLGPTAPTYAVIGSSWLDSSVANKLTSKFYDGSSWISHFTIDTVAHTLSLGGNNPTASVTVARSDVAADMIEMFRDVSTNGSGGIIYSQKNDALTKKTFGSMKIDATNVASGAEETEILFQGMIAGTLSSLMKFSKNSLFFESLKGSGTRKLVVDASGFVTTANESSSYNLFGNGKADSAELTSYTVNAPLTLVKSTTAADLIDSTTVFKAVASASGETFLTETINIQNGHIDSAMIIAMKYRTSVAWTVEILDQASAVLATETIDPYTETLSEARIKKLFGMIPTGTSTVRLQFTSTAGGTILFDGIEIYSEISKDEPLYFSKTIDNNLSDVDLFLLTSRKYSLWKVEGHLTRETDTKKADAIYSCYITNNGTIFRVGNEQVVDQESDYTETYLNMNVNTLRYTSNDLTGPNYKGKFVGSIARVI